MSPTRRRRPPLSAVDAEAQAEITAIITNAIGQLSDVDLVDVEDAINSGRDPVEILQLLHVYELISERLPRALIVPLANAGAAAFDGVNYGIARIPTRFDITDSRATVYATDRSARLVAAIDEETRANVSTIIGRSFTDGIDIPNTALAVRSVVGLTPQWANAVYNYQAGLLANGADADYIDRMVDAYAGHLLDVRSETIARTEVLTASGEGRSQGWDQAAEAGLFNAATATKTWHISEDAKLCDLCSELDGVEIALGDTWTVGEEEHDMPPGHPRCRCYATLNINEGEGGEVDEGGAAV